MTARMTKTLGRASGLLKGFTPGQRGVILVAALALVLGAVGLSRWAAQPSWTVLYSNLSGTDANAIVEQLRSDNVQYKLADGGGTVLVPQVQVYDLRVSLAGKGVSPSDGNSYSILDSQGLTATDFQQNIAYQRALEGELNRTLQSISGVQTAIVHLAMPAKDVFSDKQDQPTASVLLALQPGTTLTTDEVRAVTHLVAGSIPGLSPDNVTVTDSKGNLLSTKGSAGGDAAAVAGQTDSQTAQYESRLSSAVQTMLDKVLGPGHAVVRVNAQLNFDTRTTTSQKYVSASGVPPLSLATSTENYNGAAAGSGGALGQTYPTLTPAAGATGAGSYARSQQTVDNAVGSIVESAQAAPGTVQRLTVAVVLDSTTATKLDSTQISSLVGNAVGLDTARGDSVVVNSLPFDTTAAATAQKEIASAQSAAKTAQYLDLGKKAGLGLVVLIVAVLMLRKRGKGSPSIEAYASDLPGDGGMLMSGGLSSGLHHAALPAGSAAGAGGQAHAELSGPDPAIEAARNRENLRDEVARLVENQPEEMAQVIQSWLSQRKG